MTLRKQLSLILVLFIGIVNAQDFSIKQFKHIEGFTDYVYKGTFSPYGNYFAVTTGDNTVVLYNGRFEKVWSFQGEPSSKSGAVAFSPDEKYMAISELRTPSDVVILRLSDLKLVQEFSNVHTNYINALAFNNYGTSLVSCSSDSTMVLWVLKNGLFEQVQKIKAHKASVTNIAFTPDGKYIVSTGRDKCMRVWEQKSNKLVEVSELKSENETTCITFEPGNKYMYGGSDYCLVTWQRKDNTFAQTQKKKLEHSGEPDAIAMSPDANYVATSAYRSPVKFYKREGEQLNEFYTLLTPHKDMVFDVSFSPDGRYFVTASRDQSFIVWEITGVEPSEKVRVQQYLEAPFSEAQKRVMASLAFPEIIAHLDPKLTMPREEFETTAQYFERRKKLKAHTLMVIQQETEKLYGAIPKGQEVIVKLEDIGRYNADEKTYEVYFMGTSATVKIEVENARELKTSWKNATIICTKAKDKNGVSSQYSNFRLVSGEKQYSVSLRENPYGSIDQKYGNTKISIISPKLTGNRSVSVAQENMDLKGRVDDQVGIKQFYVNNDESKIDSAGGFQKTLKLTNGENMITLRAINRLNMSAEENFSVMHQSVTAEVKSSPGSKDSTRRNFALLFASENYTDFSALVNPINDAKTVAAELNKYYGYQTELVENATQEQVINKIREYATLTYGEYDNLFIFFAGHGLYDDVFKEGYIVTNDSKKNDQSRSSYISHSNLRTMINNIPCKHVFLTMDVCFGGTFDPLIAMSGSRAGDEYSEISKEKFIERKLKYKTRKYITSGGKEYVPDGRSGEHSPFARKFIEALRTYGGSDGILTLAEIVTFVEKVTPQPRAGEFGSNEPGSDFLFIVK